jgi:hypothetical protein
MARVRAFMSQRNAPEFKLSLENGAGGNDVLK